MGLELALFGLLALTAIVSSAGMIYAKNAVHSALFLILNFGCVALLFLMLDAPFISMVQIAVYAGAIMVLFLFVIMLLGAEELKGISEVRDRQFWPAVIFGVLLLAEIVTVVFLKDTVFQAITQMEEFGTPAAIGTTLFNDYLLPFEVVAFLLLAAMVGAIVNSRRVRQKPEKDEG